MWSDYEDKKGFYIFDTETRSTEFIPNPYNIFQKVVYNDDVFEMEKFQLPILGGCYVKVVVAEKKNPYVFDRFIDRIYKLDPSDVNIIEDSYSILNETGDFDFEAEDTLSTLVKYVDDIETELPKNKLKDLMKVLYTEAHDYL